MQRWREYEPRYTVIHNLKDLEAVVTTNDDKCKNIYIYISNGDMTNSFDATNHYMPSALLAIMSARERERGLNIKIEK